VFRSDTPNTEAFCIVKLGMTKAERNSTAPGWGNQALRERLEANPYSLTQDELWTLQAHDELAAKIEGLLNDVLVQRAVNNSFKHKR
jgi:hypothetical protein